MNEVASVNEFGAEGWDFFQDPNGSFGMTAQFGWTKHRSAHANTAIEILKKVPPLRAKLVLLLGVAIGCMGSDTSGPSLDGEGRRVLFIGNSYLYIADIPGIVQALADSAGGDKLAVETVAAPDYALIDHWNLGSARAEIAKGGWEWVVLQQGPSSVEVNRDTLRLATKLFAAEIAKINARPALFSAWPSEARREDFDRAIESYRLAAQDVNGIFLPVASSWLAAWNHDAALVLYSDGLHPSADGAYLSALVIYARLLGKSPVGLPPKLKLHNGAVITIDPQRASILQAAAVSAVSSP